MGQYYTPVVTQNGTTTIYKELKTALKTPEAEEQYGAWGYTPHGAKILEHSWWSNDLLKGIAKKFYKKSGRLAWVGDYTEAEYVMSTDGTVAPLTSDELYYGKLYERDENGDIKKDERGYNILSNKPLPAGVKAHEGNIRFDDNFTMDNKVLVNLTRKEYLNCDKYFKRSVEDDGWCIHPLSLLTSTGGDNGGGDYHSNHIDALHVGRWAYDEIIIYDLTQRRMNMLKKDGFTEFRVTFKESLEIPVDGVA